MLKRIISRYMNCILQVDCQAVFFLKSMLTATTRNNESRTVSIFFFLVLRLCFYDSRSIVSQFYSYFLSQMRYHSELKNNFVFQQIIRNRRTFSEKSCYMWLVYWTRYGPCTEQTFLFSKYSRASLLIMVSRRLYVSHVETGTFFIFNVSLTVIYSESSTARLVFFSLSKKKNPFDCVFRSLSAAVKPSRRRRRLPNSAASR